MKVAFRVDASSEIGTGHLVRCLTLADTLAVEGAHIRFVSRQMLDHLQVMLKDRGYEFASLDRRPEPMAGEDLAHAAWLGVSQATDAAQSRDALSDVSWDWIVVDCYALDVRWESALRPIARRIAVIDDIADRAHDCDLLLDQNLFEDMPRRYAGKVPAHCRMLLGPRYALLRPEFRTLRGQVAARSGAASRLLVFFGGVDAGNYTGMALGALASLKRTGISVDVVIGAQHSHLREIESESARHGFTCHVQTPRMAELMASADLAIGAGGTAIWERCCLGLPALAVSTADNQSCQVGSAARRGLLYGPTLTSMSAESLALHIASLLENAALRELISSIGMEAVDGRGANRVMSAMRSGTIAMRAAAPADSPRLFAWRNTDAIRAASRNQDPIDWVSHERWLAAVLSAPDRVLLIGERDGSPVGVVRFDIQHDAAEISIYLVPDTTHPPGHGRALLLSAEQWLVANRPEVFRVRANVLAGNERSLALFAGAGYETESTWYAKTLRLQ